LLALAGRPVFREGIRLVGRALLARLDDLARRDPARWRHDERHAAAKATAYAARFAAKTSPNSVFCAVALGRLAATAAVAGENREARREEILSIAEARKVVACLAADPTAWPAVVPRPNPTLRPDAEDGCLSFWRPATPRREGDDEVRSRVRRQ